MIGIYCRVSTPGQEDNYSLPRQHSEGISFANSKGAEFKEYEDVKSGKSITRSGYNELLRDIESKTVDSVWIGAEDRFSRDATLGLQFLDLLALHKMRLFVGTREYDPRDGNTRFIIAIKFLVAEYEWSQIIGRMKKGPPFPLLQIVADTTDLCLPSFYGCASQFPFRLKVGR
jgi:DNA invertase Pin-like site-specific DNA recombinase